jgi:hypothetical protein
MDASNTIDRLAAAASEPSALVASANTLVVKAGDKAPLFGLTDIDGNTVRSDDLLASGPLLLSFERYASHKPHRS